MKKPRATASYRTLCFTEAEVARIEKAMMICDSHWKKGQSAIFARVFLLRSVAGILKSDRESRTPGARLRARLQHLSGDH